MKTRLDILCEIEEFTNCNLNYKIDNIVESRKIFWKEKYYSKDEYNKLQLMINKLSKISGVDVSELEKELFGDD